MTGDGGLVEVQATAERTPLSRAHLDDLLALAASGIESLRALQGETVARGGGLAWRSQTSLVLATRNPHKLREFERLLAPAAIAVEPLPDGVELPPEDGETFDDNALPKARAAAAATGRAAIADDSGIEAEALGGVPASARPATPASDASDAGEPRQADARGAARAAALRYVCALAYVDPVDGAERVFFGDCSGPAGRRPRGERGFGYDPAFLPDGDSAGGRWPSSATTRRTRSATAAAPSARCCAGDGAQRSP